MKKIITLVLISVFGISNAQLSVPKIAKVVATSGSGTFVGSYTTSGTNTYRFIINNVGLSNNAVPPVYPPLTLGAGWTAALNTSSGGSATISSANPKDSITANITGSETFTLVIAAGSTANESATIKVDVYSVATQTVVATQNISLYAHPTTLLIDKSPSSFFQTAYFEGYPKIKMNSFSEFATMDTVGFNKNNIDHIVFNLSYKTAATLSEQDIENLTHYLQSGGKLFICGEDIVSNASGTSAYTTFLNTYLGVSSTTGKPSGSLWKLDPLLNAEWIFGNLAGDSLNTITYHTMSPDTLTPVGFNSTVVLKYNQKENAAVTNTSGTAGGWRVVCTGFRYEAIKLTPLKKAFLQKSIDWFDGILDGIKPEELSDQISLGQNYPNPATEITSIKLDNISSEITFKMTDMQGRVIMYKQIPAYSKVLQIDVSNLNSGIYFYQLADKNNAYPAKKLTVMH